MQHVVIRRWSGAAQLMAEMERRRDEVEQLIRGVPGFGAYYAVRTGANELVSITVCDDRAGTDESTRRARMGAAEYPGHRDESPGGDRGRDVHRVLALASA